MGPEGGPKVTARLDNGRAELAATPFSWGCDLPPGSAAPTGSEPDGVPARRARRLCRRIQPRHPRPAVRRGADQCERDGELLRRPRRLARHRWHPAEPGRPSGRDQQSVHRVPETGSTPCSRPGWTGARSTSPCATPTRSTRAARSRGSAGLATSRAETMRHRSGASVVRNCSRCACSIATQAPWKSPNPAQVLRAKGMLAAS